MVNSLRKNFGILLVATLASKLLGFIREMVIAAKFGVSEQFDLLLTVFVIPNMIVSLLLYAIPHIVIPRLDLREKSEKKFIKQFSKHFFWPYTLFLLILLILYNCLFHIYVNHFSSEEFRTHLQLATNLTIIFSFFSFFGSIFNIVKAAYNARERFTLPAFTPLLIHVSVITSVILLFEEKGVYAFAYGLLLGSILQVAVYFLDLKRRNMLKYFALSLKLEKVYSGAFVTILVIEFLGQSYALIDRSFIGSLPQGHVSSIYYAGILNNLPVTVLGLTFGTIFFPRISRYVQENNYKRLVAVVNKGLFSALGAALPFVVIFFYFGETIIKLIFERGAFSKEASAITEGYLMALALGLPFMFLHILLTRVCFALKKEKMLLLGIFIAISFKLIASYIFVSSGYYFGLSLATSISFLLNILVIGGLLYRYKKTNMVGQ